MGGGPGVATGTGAGSLRSVGLPLGFGLCLGRRGLAVFVMSARFELGSRLGSFSNSGRDTAGFADMIVKGAAVICGAATSGADVCTATLGAASVRMAFQTNTKARLASMLAKMAMSLERRAKEVSKKRPRATAWEGVRCALFMHSRFCFLTVNLAAERRSRSCDDIVIGGTLCDGSISCRLLMRERGAISGIGNLG